MPSERLQHYQNLVGNRSLSAVGVCWTVVWPAEVATVVGRLGLNPGAVERLDISTAYHRSRSAGPVLLLDQVGAAVTIFEDNGVRAVLPGVHETLSVASQAVTAYWNVEWDSRLIHSADGVIQSDGEGFHPHGRTGARPDSLDAVMPDLYEAVEDPELIFTAGMLAVVDAISGVRLELDWFQRTHDAVADSTAATPSYRRGPRSPQRGSAVSPTTPFTIERRSSNGR